MVTASAGERPKPEFSRVVVDFPARSAWFGSVQRGARPSWTVEVKLPGACVAR